MKIGGSLIVFILSVFTDDGIFMFLDAQLEMTARVAYIIAHFRVRLSLSIKARPPQVHNHSYGNEFNLHLNEISFS